MSEYLLQQITEDFSKIPQVAAFVLAGSATSGNNDAISDYDCYVYSDGAVPVAARQQIAEKYADRMEINNQYWETGDEWQDAKSGMIVDIMYRRKDWIEGELNPLPPELIRGSYRQQSLRKISPSCEAQLLPMRSSWKKR